MGRLSRNDAHIRKCRRLPVFHISERDSARPSAPLGQDSGMTLQTLAHAPRPYLESIVRRGKPKVVSMIVFTATIGMLLATPGLPSPSLVACPALGIRLVP